MLVLRYGPNAFNPTSFSWQLDLRDDQNESWSKNPIIFPEISTASLFRNALGGRNINRLSIILTFRSRTKDRLTLGWFSLPRKPWVFGVPLSQRHCGYSCQHSRFSILHQTLRFGFTEWRMLPYPLHFSKKMQSLIFGTKLSPDKSLVQNSLVSKLLRTF